MAERKKLPLAVRIVAWVLGVIIGLLAIVWVGEKLVFASFFFGGAKAEMPIPGLWNGFVQQGFDKVDDDTYFVAGYNKADGKPSAIYVVDRKGKKKDYVELYNEDGTTAWTAHAGGITHFGDWVYVAHNTGKSILEYSYCDRFLLSDVLDGDGKATRINQIQMPNKISYCSVYDGQLYVGAFYREGSDYLTPEEHHLTTPNGHRNTALLMVFDLDETTGLLASETPAKIYSTLSNVQGMCKTESGKIVLSTSWGLSASHLYVYDETKAQAARGVTIAGCSNIIYLDYAALVQDVVAPPMAEELVYENGRVMIMCESASMKYIFGKLMSGNYVHSFPIA